MTIVTNKEADLKEIIQRSGLFDQIFYLREYPDVRRFNLMPIDHYVQYGIYENRKPNREFDSVWYREHYPDVKEAGELPLVHYIEFGQVEGRFVNATQS